MRSLEMPSLEMHSVRLVSTVLAIVFCLSCAELNYPTKGASDDALVASATALELAAGAKREISEPDEPLTWSDLTRLARENRQRGELDRASERLSQAAIQVQDLPPSHVRRRTVFGLRARLANDFASAGEMESADALTAELIAQAEASPEVGGAALVSLAVAVADRREAAAREAGQAESQLPLLRIAFATAQAGSIGRDRMILATRVSKLAFRENEIVLARTAIDQALSDALHVIPAKKMAIAELRLEHARIALASGDFDTAKKSATAANRLIDQTNANDSIRGIAEATLAEILAETGEAETALVIATGAHARISGENNLTEHAQRRILAALGRVELSLEDRPSARAHFEQALAIEGQDQAEDVDLVKELTIELDELSASDPL